MRGTRTVLASGFLTLVLITGSSVRSAADECLAKPSGPTAQGQHWYYRIDHANNGRQCWYLRAESGRAQKTSPQTEPDSSDAMAQAIEGHAGCSRAQKYPLRRMQLPRRRPSPGSTCRNCRSRFPLFCL